MNKLKILILALVLGLPLVNYGQSSNKFWHYLLGASTTATLISLAPTAYYYFFAKSRGQLLSKPMRSQSFSLGKQRAEARVNANYSKEQSDLCYKKAKNWGVVALIGCAGALLSIKKIVSQ